MSSLNSRMSLNSRVSSLNSRVSSLNSRVSSSTSSLRSTTTRLYGTSNHLARKHSRVSLLAAGAATAGLVGGACAIAGAAPWDQATGNVATTVQGGSLTSSGHSGNSALDAFGGTVHASQSAPQKAKSATASTKAAVPAKAAPAAPVAKAAQPQTPLPAANPEPSAPYLMYDSVLPSALPSGQPAAVYADGPYAASASQVTGHSSVVWIDTNGSDPSANVLDVEPGDATPAGAAQWVDARLTQQPNSVAIVYTMLSDWQQVQDEVAALPSWMQSHVQYWIADPTGVPHVVPGSSATQWYWGSTYDISTANPNFEQ